MLIRITDNAWLLIQFWYLAVNKWHLLAFFNAFSQIRFYNATMKQPKAAWNCGQEQKHSNTQQATSFVGQSDYRLFILIKTVSHSLSAKYSQEGRIHYPKLISWINPEACILITCNTTSKTAQFI